MQDFDRGMQQQMVKIESLEESKAPIPTSSAGSSSSSSSSSLSSSSLLSRLGLTKARQAKQMRSDEDYSQISKFKKKNAHYYQS